MSITREQDFREVRRLLAEPKEQKPSPDIIVSNLLKTERQMLNEANSMNQAWSIETVSVPSVVDQAEYTVTANSGSTFGKALEVHRVLDNSNIMSVPMTDYLTEFSNQKYQFWIAPYDGGDTYPFSGEKVAFYRDNSTVKMRIFPIPEEVKTYVITYASGILDWTSFAWSDVPAFPEFADFRQLRAAIMSLKSCEWEGYSRQESMAYRREIREDLVAQLAAHIQLWQPFIRFPQNTPAIQEVGMWWE